jgi:putative transposase
MVYRFIKENSKYFGVRWLMSKFNLHPNAYYNFLKGRKSTYIHKKHRIYGEIKKIYHKTEGRPGYRTMNFFLRRKGIKLSNVTVHKYMNKELGLESIVRKKKPVYTKGHSNKIFPNLLKQNFHSQSKNSIWCTDFTYLFLTNGSKRYNCSIIDIYDRSVVASLNGNKITSALAIKTLKKALSSQPKIRGKLIIHSDQGAQYTSKEFVEFCSSANIKQSMSRAGCPYDNAPMERYYNTLKNELIYHHYYHNDEELDKSINNFAYIWYNHIRPHTYNNGLTQFEARSRISRN